jgi:cytochrome c oxidase subunit 1
MYNVWRTAKKAPKVTVDDPWGYGNSLEWATSCPPPRHNFVSIPRIRSERPAFDLHHPEVVRVDQPEPNKNLLDQVLGEPDLSNRNDAGGQGGTASGTGSEGSVR